VEEADVDDVEAEDAEAEDVGDPEWSGVGFLTIDEWDFISR
jgi:hypothetical protein